MRMLLPSIVWALWIAVPAAGVAADAIHAGPVYMPAFPDVEILVDLPPSNPPALPTPGSFELHVDGGPGIPATAVRTLAETGHGMAASIALDASGSMKGRPLHAVRAGLTKFVNQAGPQDRVAIQTFADESRWDVDWGDSPDRIQDAIGRLASRGSHTVLWDALLDALAKFPGTPLARRLIVISDGHDEGSQHSLQDVIAEAIRLQIPVDSIGITRDNPIYLDNLSNLSARTGGQFKVAHDEKQLEELLENGIQRLKSLPVVSFHASGVPSDGGSHTFAVTWRNGDTKLEAETLASVPSTPSDPTPPKLHPADPALPSQTNQKNRTILLVTLGLLALILTVALALYLFRILRRPESQPPAPMASVPMPQPPSVPVIVPIAAAPISADSIPRNPTSPRGPAPMPFDPSAGTVAPAARVVTQLAARFSPPRDGCPTAWLYAEEGPEPGRWFPIEAVEYWIGALPQNNLALAADPTVSAHHACIALDSDVLSIRDYNSTNGTVVNGITLTGGRRLLRPGDRVRIGRTTLTLHLTRGDTT